MATTAKVNLAQCVGEETDCPRSLALRVVDASHEGMRERLLAGDRIDIRGFGTLCVKQARARPMARNPRTGEAVRVPARRKVQFKPGQALRQGLHRRQPKGRGGGVASDDEGANPVCGLASPSSALVQLFSAWHVRPSVSANSLRPRPNPPGLSRVR